MGERKERSRAALLAVLASTAGWSQDVNVQSLTIAQLWTEKTPGFDKNTFTPATEFLGIDAARLGSESLSLHLFGWGRVDLGERSTPRGTSGGDLSYGYLEYRLPRANAEIRAGRLTIDQGVGIEQVDGVSARADLLGGFALSAFGGRPVLYRTVDPASQKDYEFQRDMIFGTRLSLRIPKAGEVGLSYLQDGSTAAKDLPIPSPVDYSRKQLGLDLQLRPHRSLELGGRTLFDIAQHPDPAPAEAKPSRVAEQDYSLAWKVSEAWSLAGAFAERNFYAYFAGTNLPSLFRQDERGRFRSQGGSLTWNAGGAFQLVADYRRTHRASYGDADRFGGEARWSPKGTKLQAGLALHRVNASDVLLVDSRVPSYSLSHREARAWVLYAGARFSASLDAQLHAFDDRANPNLNGQSTVSAAVGSVGYQVGVGLRLSGDLSYTDDPIARHEVRGLLRVELRFGGAVKGGGK